jgi:hypothetical protein
MVVLPGRGDARILSSVIPANAVARAEASLFNGSRHKRLIAESSLQGASIPLQSSVSMALTGGRSSARIWYIPDGRSFMMEIVVGVLLLAWVVLVLLGTGVEAW